MSEQQQELERVYSKLQGQEEQHGSLEIINQELVCQLDEALTKGHYYLQKVLVIKIIYKLNTSSTPKSMGETVSLIKGMFYYTLLDKILGCCKNLSGTM